MLETSALFSIEFTRISPARRLVCAYQPFIKQVSEAERLQKFRVINENDKRKYKKLECEVRPLAFMKKLENLTAEIQKLGKLECK